VERGHIQASCRTALSAAATSIAALHKHISTVASNNNNAPYDVTTVLSISPNHQEVS
jgi:hypothetical protein